MIKKLLVGRRLRFVIKIGWSQAHTCNESMGDVDVGVLRGAVIEIRI